MMPCRTVLLLLIATLLFIAPLFDVAPSPRCRCRPVYHRLGPVVADGMTMKTQVFEAQMKYLHDSGYRVIRCASWWPVVRAGAGSPPPVVIVEDDAHKSVYSDMLPVIRKYRYPVTIRLSFGHFNAKYP